MYVIVLFVLIEPSPNQLESESEFCLNACHCIVHIDRSIAQWTAIRNDAVRTAAESEFCLDACYHIIRIDCIIAQWSGIRNNAVHVAANILFVLIVLNLKRHKTYPHNISKIYPNKYK